MLKRALALSWPLVVETTETTLTVMNKILQSCSLLISVLAAVHVAPGSAQPARVSETVTSPYVLELEGLIEPFADLNVGAQVDGVLSEILVERGDSLKKGQVIARLESGLEESQLELVKARAMSTAEIDSAAAAVKLSRQRLVRTRKLYEERVASLGALDEIETELLLAELQLTRAKENHMMAQLEVKRAQALLDQRTIYSPTSGVVVERFLGVGELVYRANRDQVLRIAQVDPLRVEIFAPLAVYGQIAVGDEVQVFPGQPIGGSVTAKVIVVDPVIDAASGTIGIRCELQNKDHRIPAGLRCRVQLNLTQSR
ncbi:MAG: RND family efflux transporter MFP subunit [Candidatus Paceibacteria bacterium]|jgi:RND family efflux transporter MFP subunit